MPIPKKNKLYLVSFLIDEPDRSKDTVTLAVSALDEKNACIKVFMDGIEDQYKEQFKVALNTELTNDYTLDQLKDWLMKSMFVIVKVEEINPKVLNLNQFELVDVCNELQDLRDFVEGMDTKPPVVFENIDKAMDRIKQVVFTYKDC